KRRSMQEATKTFALALIFGALVPGALSAMADALKRLTAAEINVRIIGNTLTGNTHSRARSAVAQMAHDTSHDCQAKVPGAAGLMSLNTAGLGALRRSRWRRIISSPARAW